jgi:hypothetical protein
MEVVDSLRDGYGAIIIVFAVTIIVGILEGSNLSYGEFTDDLKDSFGISVWRVANMIGYQYTLFHSAPFLKILFIFITRQKRSIPKLAFEPLPTYLGIILWLIGTFVSSITTTYFNVFAVFWTLGVGLGGGLYRYEAYVNLFHVLQHREVEVYSVKLHLATLCYSIVGSAPFFFSLFFSLSLQTWEDSMKTGTSLWVTVNVWWRTVFVMIFSALFIHLFSAPLEGKILGSRAVKTLDDCKNLDYDTEKDVFKNDKKPVIAVLVSQALFQFAMYVPMIWLRSHLDTYNFPDDPEWIQGMIGLGGIVSAILVICSVPFFPALAFYELFLSLLAVIICLFCWPAVSTWPGFMAWGVAYGIGVAGSTILFGIILNIQWNTKHTDKLMQFVDTGFNLAATSFALTVGNLAAVIACEVVDPTTNLDSLILAGAICVTFSLVLVTGAFLYNR